MKSFGTTLGAALALVLLSSCISATDAEGMRVAVDGQSTIINPEVSDPPPVTSIDIDEPERYDAEFESSDRSTSNPDPSETS